MVKISGFLTYFPLPCFGVFVTVWGSFLRFAQKPIVLFADLFTGYNKPVRTKQNIGKIVANKPKIPFLAQTLFDRGRIIGIY